VPQQIETQRTRRKQRTEPCDPASLERAVRQLLADKISGNQVGIWLLAPEHLRLGTWDLLCAWSQSGGQTIWPRMALHLVHEAAFCVNGLRNQRSLTQKGFELSNGLPFVPTDFAIHEMLGRHTMAEAQALQVALGKIRRASGHFQGRLLGIDPHRIKSCTKRQTRRHRFSAKEKALKMAQCFFCLDLDSAQPLCFTLASAARTVTQATPELLELSQEILNPAPDQAPLVLADSEHYTTELLDHVHLETPFELLVPMPPQNSPKLQDQARSSERFNRRWAGYATAKEPFRLKQSRCSEPYYRFVQRNGERPEDYYFKSFLATVDRDEVPGSNRSLSTTLAYRRVFQIQPSPGLASGWYPQPQHPLRTNDHGVGGPSGYSPDASKTGPTFFSMGCLSPSQRTFRRSRRRCPRQGRYHPGHLL